jgi:hypothetical protein
MPPPLELPLLSFPTEEKSPYPPPKALEGSKEVNADGKL